MEWYTDIFQMVVLPLITLVGGWFANAYRNKQQKERDQMDNFEKIFDIQNKRLDKSEAELERYQTIREELEKRLDLKRKSISKARRCNYIPKDKECPVLHQEEENETEIEKIKCQSCKFHDNENGND